LCLGLGTDLRPGRGLPLSTSLKWSTPQTLTQRPSVNSKPPYPQHKTPYRLGGDTDPRPGRGLPLSTSRPKWLWRDSAPTLSLPARAGSKVRCRANMAHIRQSRPDSGRGFQVKPFELFHFHSGAVRVSKWVARDRASTFSSTAEVSGLGFRVRGWGFQVRGWGLYF